MNIFPYRVRFSKTGKVRFLSHHDVLRMFERALRRTGLPLRMTEGYNPHPILAFPTALGVGIESVDEVLEFELSSWIAPRQIEKDLTTQCPEGIGIRNVEAFVRKDRARIDFVEYEARCPGQIGGVESRITEFLTRKECVVERSSDKGTKSVDIRPYTMAVEVEEDRIFLRIRITDSGTAKPEEVLRALGIRPEEGVRIRKTHTELSTRDE